MTPDERAATLPNVGGVPGAATPVVAPPGPLGTSGPHDTAALVNLRDLGGHPTADGRTTQPGVLYRSEAPRRGDRSPSGVFAWPPRTVVDLRSAPERGRHPHPLAGGATRTHVIPLLGDDIGPAQQSQAFERAQAGLASLYAMLLEFAAPRLVDVVHLLAEAPAPILVHCAAGKDRTGLVSALMLRVAGVVHEAVLADYTATAANMPAVLARLGNSLLLPGADLAAMPELAAASTPAASHVLAVLDAHPGGTRGWLLDAGARESALDAWEARFVGARQPRDTLL